MLQTISTIISFCSCNTATTDTDIDTESPIYLISMIFVYTGIIFVAILVAIFFLVIIVKAAYIAFYEITDKNSFP